MHSIFHEGKSFPLLLPGLGESPDENVFTVIIGKNGTGKSRLLSQVCRIFADHTGTPVPPAPKLPRTTRKQTPTLVTYARDDYTDTISYRGITRPYDSSNERPLIDLLPERVIATTTTPFDKFPVPKRFVHPRPDIDELRDVGLRSYVYMGSRGIRGTISSVEHLYRVVEQLTYAPFAERQMPGRLAKVFDMLGYLPRIRVEYRLPRGVALLEELAAAGSLSAVATIIGRAPHGLYGSRAVEVSKTRAAEISDAARFIVDRGLSGSRITSYITVDDDSDAVDTHRLVRSSSILRSVGLATMSDFVLTRSETFEEIPFRYASSGEQGLTLMFLGIASAMRNNSLIIVDEPELGLHPEWQERVVPLLADVFSRYIGCHFVLATHSPQILAQAGRYNCSILDLDEITLRDASEFARRSADFQLAEAFDAPGSRNEYLLRIALTAMSMAGTGDVDSQKFLHYVQVLRKARKVIKDDDPVAEVTDSLVSMLEEALGRG